MEVKEFEKFYSLCERTVSRQRLLGANDKDIAFVLTGIMMATLPEDELTLEQHKKLVELVVGKEETAKIMSEEEFRLYLERTETKPQNSCFLIGWATAPVEQAYTSEQLRRIFALLADE